jgi:hypothetical protein
LQLWTVDGVCGSHSRLSWFRLDRRGGVSVTASPPLLHIFPLIFEAHADSSLRLLGYNLQMPHPRPWRLLRRQSLPLGSLLALLLVLSACKSAHKPDTEQQDQAQMWLDSVPELKPLNVSNAEIGELQKAHDAGLTDPSAVVLIKLARERQKPFKDGQSIADLLGAGSSEQTVLELARMDQLGIWAGEAHVLRLAGLSDKTILAVARRRSQGLTVLSGEKLGELKNAGFSDAEILGMVQKGMTDKTASVYITQRERAAGGHRFVYQGRGRRR